MLRLSYGSFFVYQTAYLSDERMVTFGSEPNRYDASFGVPTTLLPLEESMRCHGMRGWQRRCGPPA